MTPSLFGSSRRLLFATLAVIFLAALVIRVYDLTDLPLDFAPARQLQSMIKARGMYYQNASNVPEWQRQIAIAEWKGMPTEEPEIVEHLAAFSYRLAGAADLWIPRLYSIFFWLVGGVFLFLLARDMTNADGAVVALLFYLFLPYGAIASRAFMPDPLMVMCMIIALWAQYRWYQKPAWGWAIAAGLLGGLAIYTKATAVFMVVGAAAGLILAAKGLKKALLDLQVWVIAILTVLPGLAYNLVGLYVAHFLGTGADFRVFPVLLKEPSFYVSWFSLIDYVAGAGSFLVALAGTFLFSTRSKRAMMAGLWLGYLAFGLVFAYFFETHDYYHLPLIPVIALGLAPIAELVISRILALKWGYAANLVILGVLLLGVVPKAWDVRVTLKRADYRHEAAYWAQLGQKLNYSDKVVALTHDYGGRLEYWGWTVPEIWMTTGDLYMRSVAGDNYDMKALFQQEIAGKDFFLVTLLNDLDHQAELKQILYNNYPIYDKGDGYVIFDLRHPLASPPANPAAN